MLNPTDMTGLTERQQARQRKQAEIDNAFSHLTALLQPGQEVFVICRRANRNLDFRHLKLYVPAFRIDTAQRPDGQPFQTILDISYWAAKVLDRKLSPDTGGITVRGGGMDMGFSLVCELSYRLFKDERQLQHRWL